MKTVRYYNNPIDAQMDKQLLSAHGIPAEIFNELVGVPAISGSSGSPYLAVPDSYYDRAAAILDATVSESKE